MQEVAAAQAQLALFERGPPLSNYCETGGGQSRGKNLLNFFFGKPAGHATRHRLTPPSCCTCARAMLAKPRF
jgi:hypothetical protein